VIGHEWIRARRNSGSASGVQVTGGVTQMEAVEKTLSRIGVRLHKLPKLHSKIIAIDTDRDADSLDLCLALRIARAKWLPRRRVDIPSSRLHRKIS
jgi:hypothetical protein